MELTPEQEKQVSSLINALEEESTKIAYHICGAVGAISDQFPLSKDERQTDHENHQFVVLEMLCQVAAKIMDSHVIGEEAIQQHCAERFFSLGARSMAGSKSDIDVEIKSVEGDENLMSILESMGETKH